MLIDPENEIFYSVFNVWEIAIKRAAHPDQFNFTSKDFVKLCCKAGYKPLEGRIRHIFSLETLRQADDAPRHKDPFDRMLLAQAKAENMKFITHDELIPYYKEPCIIKV